MSGMTSLLSLSGWVQITPRERTHIVSWVPSSGLLLVLTLPPPLLHPAMTSARAAAAAIPMAARRRKLIAISAP